MQSQENENLLNVSASRQSSGQTSGRPSGLPDAFWDEQKKQVKLDELIAAYNDLAKRDDNLVETNLRNIPESYDQYRINIPSPLLDVDEDILKRFYDCLLYTSPSPRDS